MTIADRGEAIPVYLRDDCGILLIRPEGVKLPPARMFDETCGLGNPRSRSAGSPGS
jgi:hypothetical protein